MGKFYDIVGYVETVETVPGVWQEQTIERKYYGDVVRNTKRWEAGQDLNDNLNVSNSISIMADAYAYEHFFAIRYIKWMGALWKVTTVDVQRPRLILTIGGVYNGKEDGPTADSGEDPGS